MNNLYRSLTRVEIAKRVIRARYPNMAEQDLAERVRTMVPTPSFQNVEIVDPNTIQFSRGF